MLVVEDFLANVDKQGIEYVELEDLTDELEEYLILCNYENDKGEQLVEDNIYDRLVEILREVKPESELLSTVWEDFQEIADGRIVEGYDNNINGGAGWEYLDELKKHPMMSIQTIKSLESGDYNDFIENASINDTFFVSFKINGHALRVVYQDGYLVSATSRARSSTQRQDRTEQMKAILGEYNEALDGMGLVEIRGELCLSRDKLEEAREYNPTIKSEFTAVSSLVAEGAGIDRWVLLDFLAYRLYGGDFDINSRSEEYEKLTELGFTTPDGFQIIQDEENGDLDEIIKDAIMSMEETYEDYPYLCDGLVFEVDNFEDFDNLGDDGGKYFKGNIALKVGKWSQEKFSGIVQAIKWKKGKGKLSPVAVISSGYDDAEFDENGDIINEQEIGVLTTTGNRVRNVPLYEPRNILILDAYPGNILHFNYGGEAGVVPCFKDGKLLSDDTITSMINRDGGSIIEEIKEVQYR